MSVVSFLKELIFGRKTASVVPKTSEISIENIIFPDTYKYISSYCDIPNRSDNALSGVQFGQSIINIPANQNRDNIIYQELINGNIPDWLRQFKPITISDGTNTLVYFVSSDVAMIGDNSDFLRISLNAYTARKLVDKFECLLPTKVMSDQIWQSADLKLMPAAMGASFEMTNTATLINHNNIIEKQRNNKNFNIITGHKKDIVYAKHLLEDNTKIAIYGWHLPQNGKAIQGPRPNSTSHSASYQDYSHSIRLVSQKALLNNQEVNLYDILNDQKLTHLINDEGPFDARGIYK